MSILNSSGFEIDVNPDDGPASREWILEHVSDPDVVAVCVMHGQPGDKVDEEFLGKCAKGVKVVSTFSVGFGESSLRIVSVRRDFVLMNRPHQCKGCEC